MTCHRYYVIFLFFIFFHDVCANVRILVSEPTYILISGRNALYNVSTTGDIKENWFLNITVTGVDTCIAKGHSFEDCQNYPRIVTKDPNDLLIVCGTNAFDPRCDFYHLNVNSPPIFIQSRMDPYTSPDDPQVKSAFLMHNYELYSAFTRNSRSIIHRPPMFSFPHEPGLNKPEFLGAIAIKDHVAFIFQERTPTKYPFCLNKYNRITRIGSVCMKEKYEHGSFKWSLFYKKTIHCNSTRIDASQFSIARAITVDYSVVYIIFTASDDSKLGSVVCSYNKKLLDMAFEETACGINRSTNKLDSETFNESLNSKSIGPSAFLFHASSLTFTAIAVQTIQKRPILYIGTDTGDILKINADGQIVTHIVLGKVIPIRQLYFKNRLYIISDEQIIYFQKSIPNGKMTNRGPVKTHVILYTTKILHGLRVVTAHIVDNAPSHQPTTPISTSTTVIDHSQPSTPFEPFTSSTRKLPTTQQYTTAMTTTQQEYTTQKSTTTTSNVLIQKISTLSTTPIYITKTTEFQSKNPITTTPSVSIDTPKLKMATMMNANIVDSLPEIMLSTTICFIVVVIMIHIVLLIKYKWYCGIVID